MFFSLILVNNRRQLVLLILQWRHNEHDGVWNHQPHDCLLNHLFRRRSKKASKLHVTGLFGGKCPVTGEFPAQRASNAENVSIWWRHHDNIWVTLLRLILCQTSADHSTQVITTYHEVMERSKSNYRLLWCQFLLWMRSRYIYRY